MKTTFVINCFTLILLLAASACTKDVVPIPLQPESLDLRGATEDVRTVEATIVQAEWLDRQVTTANGKQAELDTGTDYPIIDLNANDELVIVEDHNSYNLITGSSNARFYTSDRTFRVGGRIRAFFSLMSVPLSSGLIHAVTDEGDGRFYFESADAQGLRILIICRRDGGRFGLLIADDSGMRAVVLSRQDDGRKWDWTGGQPGLTARRASGHYFCFKNLSGLPPQMEKIPFDIRFDFRASQLQISSLLPIKANWLNLFSDACYPSTTMSGIEDTHTYRSDDGHWLMEVEVEPHYWYCLLNQPRFRLSFKVN